MCVDSTCSIFQNSSIRNVATRNGISLPSLLPPLALPASTTGIGSVALPRLVLRHQEAHVLGSSGSTHLLSISHPTLSWAPVLSCFTRTGNRPRVVRVLLKFAARTELRLAPSVLCCLEALAQGCHTKCWVSDFGVSLCSGYHPFFSFTRKWRPSSCPICRCSEYEEGLQLHLARILKWQGLQGTRYPKAEPGSVAPWTPGLLQSWWSDSDFGLFQSLLARLQFQK